MRVAFGFGLLAAVVSASTTEDATDFDLTYEGELEGFDINEYIGNNELFEQFAKNYR